MTRRHLHERARARGFTIIELLVAMAVASVVVASAFAIFTSTSEGMYEVSSMTMSTDRVRFAMEILSRDLQTAGSFGTINSSTDEWVDAQQSRDYSLRAIYVLGNAGSRQNQRLGPQDLSTNAMLQTSSDSVILVGAYDLPMTFELNGLDGGSQFVTEAKIPLNRRGAYRFVNVDAFDVRTTSFSPADVTNGVQHRLFSGNADAPRLLRVLDRNGFAQFATVGAIQWDVSDGFTLPLGTGNSPVQRQLRYRQGSERAGLEPSSEEDVGYDATFLDAIRYRVCVDPLDERNLNLVRERINPDLLMKNDITASDVPAPETCGNLPAGVILEQNIITNHVVDFQVWFDCADATNNQLVNTTFGSGWITPETDTTSNAQANCLAPEVGSTDPFLARIAHARLSLRTEDERVNIDNYGFLTATGTTTSPNMALGTLQTFDLDGNNDSAARVITMQTDIELPNFILRAGTRQRLNGR